MSDDCRLLLDLLSEVITLPELPSVHAAVVIDYYKNPQDGQDPYSWPNTETGDLVNRGKYRLKFDPVQQAVVGRQLSAMVCDVVTAHPLFRTAAAVLDVPGHDSENVSFGSRLAATVARDTGKESIRVQARDRFRPEAKAIGAIDRATMLHGQFYLDVDLSGKEVVIVDDVYRSGQSMAAVAAAAETAGAGRVYGICAVRTMRRY